MRQIILDTETTGLSPEEGHRIIEIGCLEMVNRRLTGKHLHLYINPQREIEREAQEVHGITNEFLADKPLFKDIAKQFIEFVKDADLIIHNAPFDTNFLNHELRWVKKGYLPIEDYCGIIDTLVIAREKHPGQQNNLDVLCRRYHVDNSNRELHGALLDSELLAQVYLLMTGGQGQLFAESNQSKQESTVKKEIEYLSSDRAALKVIKATDEEIKTHEAFIDAITEAKA